EDRRRRLARKLLERDRRVLAGREPRGARLDEPAHERPVLVERRPPATAVLLECERDLGAAVHVLGQPAESAEAEAPERLVEPWCAQLHERRLRGARAVS